jgi:acyl-CoA thioesterase-1
MIPFRPSRAAFPAYGSRRAFRNLVLAFAALLALAGTAAAEVRILAFGDSLVAGYGLPESEGFVPQLQAWLRANGAPDATVLNAGVSGDTTAGGLARIGWALEGDVDAVIVELGANDMLRGLDVGQMQQNLDGILDAVVARNLPVLLAGIPAPPNFGKDYARAFKATFKDLAAEHDAIYVGSFLAGMGRSGNVREVMRLMQRDGLHPTAEGVELNVEAIGPSVLKLVERARARQ